ncbi:TPA: hypothetical protein N0F65_007173 [Lagenidium giganteum]|uniref:Nucleotide exchange factor SIL1 n=1 Tax=Lagenidium giganteum TaxID=4803 RepID=A0AAV2ZAF2_9STRA|nr:TPA: hypothetical protein N0F65_007173 [Lagenidium giganteum]
MATRIRPREAMMTTTTTKNKTCRQRQRSGARFAVLVAVTLALVCVHGSGQAVAESTSAVVMVDSLTDATCAGDDGTCTRASDDAGKDTQIAANVPEFEPTDEWQELLPGQGVPPGLHVRLNLATGKREAKLLDDSPLDPALAAAPVDIEVDRSEANSVTVTTDAHGEIANVAALNDVERDQTVGQDSVEEAESSESLDEAPPAKEPAWNTDKMYEVLQQLPEPPTLDGMSLSEAHAKMSSLDFRRKMIKLWKKRQEDLKEAIDSMQNDAHFLAKLLDEFREGEREGSTEKQVNALEVLEWELQDLDKTHVFNYIGGFAVINEYLNASDMQVRAAASWVIGTAVKNYQDGQDWAISAGVIPKLLDSLELSVNDAQDSGDVLEVKKKALYALSSLIRFNDRGQRLFLQNNGVEILAGLFTPEHFARLQLKAALLVHDLLLESHGAVESSDQSALAQIQQRFQSTEWCNRMHGYFQANAERISKKQTMEVLSAMTHQLPGCQEVYRGAGLLSKSEAILAKWQAEDDDDLDDGNELSELVTKLRDVL